MKYTYKKKKIKNSLSKAKTTMEKSTTSLRKKNEEGRSKFLSLLLCPM
jgi:hypothetical protein